MKAIWWFTPALLEPCDGPWGRLLDFGHDWLAAWKAIIDWAERLKIDYLIPGIEPYMSDRVYNQWGFHYVCHFPDDPQARCFDEDTVQRNIDLVRSVAAYGMERNVGIMFHHYNLMAPERWLRAHPDLWRKVQDVHDPVWGNQFHNDRLGNIMSNICWNDPVYRSFLQRCWQEAFDNIPELTGAMITAGEFMFCRCPDCTGGEEAHVFQGPKNKQENESKDTDRRDKKRGEMIIDLINTFQQTMDNLNKKAIVRNWCVERWLDQMPKGIEYATKYSVFDACRGGPDPVVHQWLDAGHKMWETLAIEAENCGPVLWHDEDWCRETTERINKLDIEGCIVHINTQWGHKGHIGAHTASRNITRVLEQLSPEVLAGNSEQDFQNFFGDTAGPVILEAAKNLADFPLDMTTAVHLHREGFSFGMPPWFDGHWRWPGVLGSPKYRPPEWLESEDITDIYELIQSVAQEPESYSRVMKRTEGTAFTLCDNIAERCERAVELLENCPEPSSLPAKSELRALTAGAHIAIQAAREHGAVLRARLAWEAVKCLPDKSTECEKARECAVKWYEQAVEALNRQIPRAMDLAMIYPDVMHHVVSSRETINRLTMATRLRIRREELRRIKTVTGPEWADAMTVEFWPHLPHTIGSGARR